jgi:hypothetical protein
MARAPRPMDISNVPELLRLVEEVRRNAEPRVLRRDSEDLAILTPVKAAPRRKPRRVKTKADYEAFLSAAGSWKDVDTDKLIADIYESRRRSYRPPVEL